MDVLEIITLRSLEGVPEELAQELLGSLGEGDSEVRLELYRHVTVGTDLSIHLHREVDRGGAQASDLGLRLAVVLREHGQVSHSVWEPVKGKEL